MQPVHQTISIQRATNYGIKRAKQLFVHTKSIDSFAEAHRFVTHVSYLVLSRVKWIAYDSDIRILQTALSAFQIVSFVRLSP